MVTLGCIITAVLHFLMLCNFSFPQSQDFLLQMPVGNGGLGQELPATGGRLTNGGTPPTLPTLPVPDLTTPMTADTVCSCEACNERR